MNRDFILNEWIPALRSGKYNQGKNVLRDHEDRYCCLGVACDLLVHKGVLPEWHKADSAYGFVDNESSTDATLPPAAVTFIGMTRCGELLIDPSGSEWDDENLRPWGTQRGRTHTSLVSANDNGVRFSTIANWLEAVAKDPQP